MDLWSFPQNMLSLQPFISVDKNSFLPKDEKPRSHFHFLFFFHTAVQSSTNPSTKSPLSRYIQNLLLNSHLTPLSPPFPPSQSHHHHSPSLFQQLPRGAPWFPFAPFNLWQKGGVLTLKVSQVSSVTPLLKAPLWLPVSHSKSQSPSVVHRVFHDFCHCLSGLILYYSLLSRGPHFISFPSSNISSMVPS